MPDPFFFHESIFGLKNLEDLKGFNIGILDQDYAVEFVTRELPDAAIKKYGSHKALFDGVAKGEVRVFICDTPTALYFLEKLNLLSSFRYHLASPLYRKPFYSAVKEGNDALVAQINKGLELISADERAAIERKWMGPSENRETDVLVVAVAQSFPPFSMLNAENRPSGLLIDLWERWSVTTGNSLIFRFYDRNNAVNALKDGIVDIVSFLPPRQTTKGWTQASSAFYRLSWYLYHHKNRSNRPLAKGQTQRTLGAVTGSRAYEWLASSRRNIRVAGFETTRQMILAAAEGKIDGFLALPQEMAVLPDRLGYPEAFVQSDNPLFRQQMGGIVRNLNPDLIQRIDQGFNAIGQAERIQIESRWIRDKKARVFNPVNDQILLTRDEQQWLSAHQDLSRSIRLGVDPQWPPFEFIGDNFAYKGMVSDYVNLLNERLALNMVVAEQIPGGMDRTKTVFSRVDVVPSAISFESEKVGMLRTQAYLEFPWVIINKQQAPLIGGIRDFHGKTLAVIQRYAVKDLLGKEHPEIRILEVKTTRQGLAGILDKAIASISDQEHDRIRQKWFSVRFEHKVDEAYMRGSLLKIGIAALIIAGVFLFWNWQIRKRKEAAEAANMSKTKFMASLSHEIRTPLNAILGMTEMTLRSKVSVQQKKNLTAVKDSALHLLDVITDILDFSTIEAGKMRIQNQVFYLDELLNSLKHTWKFLAKEKGLWFHLITDENLPLAVKTDPVRLQQVLGNLISNAVKFTHTGGVTLTVKKGFFKHRHQDDPNIACMIFKIEDTGIGIQKDQIETIFERFTQAETSVTRNYGGTGLGLSICREAARLMGGRLTVRSTPGKGSRFYLKMPLKIADRKDATRLIRTAGSLRMKKSVPEAGAQGKTHGLTFLLADDDPMNAAVFETFMDGTGHRVIHAGDGEKAISQLKQNRVDMVFMDIEMPRMDGISACKSIRNGAAGEINRNKPVIAMSAHVLDAFEQQSRAAGMDEFIAKPVDIDHLFSIIEKFRPPSSEAETAEPAARGNDALNSLPSSVHPLDDLLDAQKALASVGGNESLLWTIIQIFIQETPEQLKALSKAVSNKNLTDAARYAHTLKGAAARIFSQAHADQAKDLEACCRAKDMIKVKAFTQKMIHDFEDLIEKLNRIQGEG